MKSFAALLALASTAAAIKGFNYSNTFTTGAAKMQSDFEKEFDTAAHLDGTEGFTSARLYTMIQGGTTSDPISAIPAAIKTKTSLLLGLWTSGDEAGFQNEIKALKAAIAKYGKEFIDLVDGISVGSEDLYRASPMGQAAGSNPGTGPNELVSFIKQTREALKGTGLEGAKIGHVDTWTAWDDGANAAVAEACDWVGMDAYPYFQDTVPNAIGKSSSLFKEALAKTAAGGHGKPVWITETGHPVSGKKSGDSVASIENAEKYWKDVGCPLFDTHNVWWYTLQDASPDTPNPSFGVVGSTLSTKPLFDLSCKDSDKSSSSSSSGSTKTGSGSGAGATGGSHSGSGSGSGSHSGSGSGSGSAGSMTNSAGLPIGTGSLGYPSSNGTYTSPSAKPTGTDSGSGSSTGSAGGAASSPPVSGAAGVSGALGAAFLGLIAAVFTL